ncbi:hypothetical protein EDC04DRAFT_59176 [Pisolithus marmoratus]|nr:hypothetical protein EDC04DRAFT_59176 [Pisolithus marmoratus]
MPTLSLSIMVAISKSQFLHAAWTAQTIRFLEVVPSAIMMYDYVLTLEEEVDFIWNKSVSVASAIYLITRYIGTAFIVFSTTIFVSDTRSVASGQMINRFSGYFPVVESWFSCVLVWLVQIILQMRLYAVYHGSKKILLVGLIGFIVEIAITIACMVQITKFEVSELLDVVDHLVAYPAEASNIYINYGAIIAYECLLFALAVYAAIRRYREERAPLPVNLKKMRDLRTILISGNVAYFFGTLLYVIAYSVVSLTLPTQWVIAVPRLGSAIIAVFGCHLVLHIRTSRSSTGLDSQEHESHSLSPMNHLIPTQ